MEQTIEKDFTAWANTYFLICSEIMRSTKMWIHYEVLPGCIIISAKDCPADSFKAELPYAIHDILWKDTSREYATAVKNRLELFLARSK
jgi:hypothetical protein